MNHPEAYVAAYYERVLKYATLSNVRFPGPAGRNWTDLDLVALPLPALDGAGHRRPAHVIQVKWRARFTLGVGNEGWLDDSVVNAPQVHEHVQALLGDWPYEVVLVTTNVWLSTVPDQGALRARLDQSAKDVSPDLCRGAKLLTFEEIAEDWRKSLGTAVRGWAEDPFSFQLQVHQLGSTEPPGPCALPTPPSITASDAEVLLAFDPTDDEHVDIAWKWFDALLAVQQYKVLGKGIYKSKPWHGLSARVWGGVWVYFGQISKEGAPALSVWKADEEILRFEVVSADSFRLAGQNLVAALWW